MKKLCLAILISLFLFGTAYAGPAKVFVFQEVSGVSVSFSDDSGTSRICVIDLKQAIGPDQIFGLYTITYPHGGRSPDGESGVTYITYSDTVDACSESYNHTGNANTAGVTVPFYYIATNTPKTAREIESIGKSGVTVIATLPINSSATPYQMQQFTPEPGRYLHILCGSSSTPYNRPGVIVGIN